MWSEEDIQFLFDNPDMAVVDIAAKLKKTVGAVKSKRSRLKIRAGSERGQQMWTTDERNILKKYYGDWDKLEELLPGRSKASIRSQAHYLRERQWDI